MFYFVAFRGPSLEGPIIKEFGTKAKEEVTLDIKIILTTPPYAPPAVVSFIAVYQIFLHCMSQICLVIIDSHRKASFHLEWSILS